MTGAAPGSLIVEAGDAVFSFLQAGSGPPLVLLHGIGSAAVSFCHQLDGLSADFRVVAWDAPGYGGSTSLAASKPDPGGYAAALECFLDALALDRIHLLGHSLGTLIAARFTVEQPERVITLTLAGVARGHGRLSAPEQRRALAARLNDVAELGPRGMAEKRGPRLLGPDATPAMNDQVVETMARVRPDGYAAAARMLSAADILADIARLPVGLPVQIIVGASDTVTAPESNRAIAGYCQGAPFHLIPGAGHALYLEKPQAFNRLVRDLVMQQTGSIGVPDPID